MLKINRLVAILTAPALALAVLSALALPAAAKTKKGDRLAAEGERFEQQREFDKALEKYEQALASDPSDFHYQLLARRVRFQAGQAHVLNGEKLRTAGKLDEALAEYNKAFTIDPSSTSAEQEIRRTLAMIEREKQRLARGGAPETPAEIGLTPAQTARKESEQRESAMLAPPELRPAPAQPLDLKISNQSMKTLYDTVGTMAAVNVLFDPELTSDNKKFSLDLKNSSLEEALDYVALLTHTFWKPVSANAIFVTQESVAKRRDYEDQVTRVFYLANITSPPELQEVMTAVRTVSNFRLIFPVNSQNALVVRGTRDQVDLAEKIILDLDKPKPEVLVDLLIIEVNKDISRQLAASIASGGTAGLSSTITSTPATTTTTASGAASTAGVLLSQIGHLGSNSWSVTMPGGMIQAMMSDTRGRILTAPQLRGVEGQKASLKIGEKYPYASGSFQSGVGTSGGLPYAQTQFQFADIGVNVEITPRVHGTDEVTLQVDLDISTIASTLNLGGLSQPVIGQRKVSHIIRLKEGEATVIGGLMQQTQTSTRNGFPGLMNVPVLGRLFSSSSTDNNSLEILVVLVPHIVRSAELTAQNTRAVASGVEQIWKVNYRHPPAPPLPAGQKPSDAKSSANPPGKDDDPPPVEQPAAQADQTPAPQLVATVSAAPAGSPGSPVPLNAAPPPPPPPGNATPGGARSTNAIPAGPSVTLVASAQEVAVGATFTVQMNVMNVKDLTAAPTRLKYDPAVLKLLEVKQGGFLGKDVDEVIFSQVPSKQGGETLVQLQRVAGSTGVAGSGTLLTMKFQALAAGTSPIAVVEFTLRNSKLLEIHAAPPQPASVVVK
ncbi:MAG: cohesin domain-containing protein [Bryobacteraceae bacterium]|jgi:general secretion pathway protein D